MLCFFENAFMIVLFVFYEWVLKSLGELFQSMRFGSHVSKRNLTILCKYLNFLSHVGCESCLVIAKHGITNLLSHILHFLKLNLTTGWRIEKIQFIKLICHLITLFCDIIISESEGSLCQLCKAFFIFQFFCCIKGCLNVSTSNCQIKSSLQIRLKEECYLWMSLLF